jgi:hypothetical protein
MIIENTPTPAIEAPIYSHSLKAVAIYLGKKNETREKEGISEGDALLEMVFFNMTALLNAINSSVTLSNQVNRALQREVAKMKGEELPEEPAEESKIIIPDRFH